MRSHLFRLLLRQYIEHKNPSNLRIHVWSNAVFWAGWTIALSQISVSIPVPFLGANLGAWWVAVSAVYWIPLDATVSGLVIAWSAALAAIPFIPWGPGHGWLI